MTPGMAAKALDARLDSEARQPVEVDEVRALREEVARLRRLLDRSRATVRRLAGFIESRRNRAPASTVASYDVATLAGQVRAGYDEARLIEEADAMCEALRW